MPPGAHPTVSAPSPAAGSIGQATMADAYALSNLARDTFPLASPPGTRPEDIAAFIAAHLTEAHFAAALTDPRDVRAQRFYRRAGFAVIGSRGFQLGSAECRDVVMARALPTPPPQ